MATADPTKKCKVPWCQALRKATCKKDLVNKQKMRCIKDQKKTWRDASNVHEYVNDTKRLRKRDPWTITITAKVGRKKCNFYFKWTSHTLKNTIWFLKNVDDHQTLDQTAVWLLVHFIMWCRMWNSKESVQTDHCYIGWIDEFSHKKVLDWCQSGRT